MFLCLACGKTELNTENTVCKDCLRQASFFRRGFHKAKCNNCGYETYQDGGLIKCEKCNHTEPIANICVGKLIDGTFHCLDCASWWPWKMQTDVFCINLGIYTQVCATCHQVIYYGGVDVNLFHFDPEIRTLKLFG